MKLLERKKKESFTVAPNYGQELNICEERKHFLTNKSNGIKTVINDLALSPTINRISEWYTHTYTFAIK